MIVQSLVESIDWFDRECDEESMFVVESNERWSVVDVTTSSSVYIVFSPFDSVDSLSSFDFVLF